MNNILNFKLLTIFLVLTFQVVAFSQTNLIEIDEIKNLMSSEERKELDNILKIKKEGDNLKTKGETELNKVEEFESQIASAKGRKKKKIIKKQKKQKRVAYKQLIKSTLKYSEANKSTYNLYRINLSKIIKDATDGNKKIMNENITLAKKTHKKSISERNKAKSLKKNDEKYYEICQNAEQLENEAIIYQMQVYKTFFNTNEIINETSNNTKIVGNSNNNETTNNETINNTSENNNTSEHNNTSENNNISEIKQENVIFRIQIAASKVKLSDTKLKSIWPDFDPETTVLIEDIHGEWIKYLVGEYTEYEDACLAEEEMQIKGSFIVAFIDGWKRVENIEDVCDPYKHPCYNRNK